MKTTKPAKSETKLEPIHYSHDQLLKALYFVYDLFSRANVPFFLLDDTAKSAKDGKPLSGSEVTVGIRHLDFQPSSFSILEAFYLADMVSKKFVKYTYEGVPIMVKIMHTDDSMFTSTNLVPYQHEYFCLPNPFDKYLEIYYKHG